MCGDKVAGHSQSVEFWGENADVDYVEKRLNHALFITTRYSFFLFALLSTLAKAADVQIVRLEEDERTATIRLPQENFYKEGDQPRPHLETTEQEDRRKELVRYHRSKIKRRYASNDDSLGRTFLRQTFAFSVGAAVYGESGTNNLWPNGLVQFALGRTTTVGIQAGYFTFGGNSVSGTSYYGTINYHYYPYEAFVGPTGRFGIGMASTNYTATSGLTNTTGTTTPIMAVGSIGWRWLTESRLNIGLEAGFQIQQLTVQTYFSSTAASSSITFFLPMIQLDIGYAF